MELTPNRWTAAEYLDPAEQYPEGSPHRSRGLVEDVQDDLAALDGGPLPALVIDGGHPHQGEHHHPLGPGELSLVVLGLGRPRQEGGHVLRKVVP